MGRAATWLYIGLLALLAGLSFWLEHSARIAGPAWDGQRRHDIDYDISRFAATTFNLAGRPEHQLAAARMYHYPDNNATLLDAPRYARLEAGRGTVTVTARHGQVLNSGDDVWFLGDVVANYVNAAGKPATLTTQRLQVLQKQDLVRSGAPVTITTSDARVTADRLTLDTRTRIAQLTGHVAAHYRAPAAARRP